MSGPFRFVVLFLAASVLAYARPQVVTTHTLLNDLVAIVGSDRVDVKCILPVNLDPHGYEPKPADIRLLAHADLVVINGLGLEPWVDKIIANSGFHGPTVKAAEKSSRLLPLAAPETSPSGAYSAHQYDPHAWHNPINVKQYIAAIRDALVALDPSGAEVFNANASHYDSQLDDIDRYTREQFSTLPSKERKLVTSHDSLRYLADAYGLTIVPVAGTRPDQEPSARQLAQLVSFIRDQHVSAVFFEATTNPKMVELVAREANVKVVGQLYTDSLGPSGSPGATYLGMFRFNVDAIVGALRGAATQK